MRILCKLRPSKPIRKYLIIVRHDQLHCEGNADSRTITLQCPGQCDRIHAGFIAQKGRYCKKVTCGYPEFEAYHTRQNLVDLISVRLSRRSAYNAIRTVRALEGLDPQRCVIRHRRSPVYRS